jgi:hypothetical protein
LKLVFPDYINCYGQFQSRISNASLRGHLRSHLSLI